MTLPPFPSSVRQLEPPPPPAPPAAQPWPWQPRLHGTPRNQPTVVVSVGLAPHVKSRRSPCVMEARVSTLNKFGVVVGCIEKHRKGSEGHTFCSVSMSGCDSVFVLLSRLVISLMRFSTTVFLTRFLSWKDTWPSAIPCKVRAVDQPFSACTFGWECPNS
jgi:hypothetical protein